MNVAEMLERLGLGHLVDIASDDDHDNILQKEVVVVVQPNYPMLTKLKMAKMVDGTPTLAVSDNYDYADRDCWDPD